MHQVQANGSMKGNIEKHSRANSTNLQGSHFPSLLRVHQPCNFKIICLYIIIRLGEYALIRLGEYALKA